MKKSLKKNYIYNVSYQILAIILPIFTAPYLARTLGATGNGIYGYTVSIVTYFILFGTLGMNLYGQREIAYVQNNREKRSKVFFELLMLRIICMLISMILFYLIFARSGEYSIYYKILLIEMFANLIDVTWFFQGLEDFKKITIRNFLIKILSLISLFIFVKDKNDVDIYLLIYSLCTFLGNFSLCFSIRKLICKVKHIEIIKHIKPMLTLFIPQIAIQVYVVLDKTMLGYITKSMTEVGYYEQAQKIIRLLLTIVSSLSLVMMPRIAKNFAEGNHEKIKIYMEKSFNFLFFLALPLMFGVMVVANNFVPVFFGPGYDKVPMIMIISSIIILFVSLSTTTGNQYLLSINRQKEYTISVVVGAIVNFLLNTILIYYLKSYGAAIATVVAEFSVAFVQYLYVRKEFDFKQIIIKSKNYFIASIIMFIICVCVDYFIDGIMLGLVLQVFTGVIVYFSVLFLLKDKFLIDTLYQVFSKLRDKINK